MPAFVSTLCICIVFVPMFFLSGVARFLFVPLAEAVVFAMIASYILSRTLVPTLVMLLMRGAHGDGAPRREAEPAAARLPQLRPRSSSACARAYTLTLVGAAREAQASSRVAFLAFCRALVPALPGARPRLLPDASTPARSACTCAPPTGTRIEETARIADDVEAAIRELIPKDQLETILDNLGVPNSGINLVVQQRRHHRHARRRDPDVAAGRATGRPRSS